MATAQFTQLLSDVYTITGRPDLVAETTLAVRQATLKAHSSDYFPRDLFESGIAFNTSEFYQQFDYSTLFPRWRSLKYLRKYDSIGSTAGKFLKVIEPESLLDSYGLEKTDLVYQAGSVIQIKTLEATQYFIVGCYLFPDTNPDTYSSWIADMQDTAIVVPAAAMVFKMIGYDEMSATFNQLAADQYAMLKINFLQAQGY